ncbi:MAG: hypothetical protein ACOX5W_06245 [Bacillota bacterium]
MISGERFSAVYRITGSENEALEKAKGANLETQLHKNALIKRLGAFFNLIKLD